MTEWVTPEQWTMRFQAAELDGDVGDDGYRVLGAAVIILSQDIGFEYPAEASTLLAGLEAAGADRSELLRACSALSPPSTPVSTRSPRSGECEPGCQAALPVRRHPVAPQCQAAARRRTHLVCWRIDQAGQEMLAAAWSPGSQR